MIFFLTKSQLALFDTPVHVAAHVRKDGSLVGAHMRIQKVAVRQPSLFDDHHAAPAAPKRNKLDIFLTRYGGPAGMARIVASLTEGQQQALLGKMAEVGKTTPEAVAEMLAQGAKLEPVQGDLLSQPTAIEAVAKEPETSAKPEKDEPAPEAGRQSGAGELVEYTTKKGKTLRGVVRTDLNGHQAAAIDPYTFRYNGGWFIREKHLTGNADAETPAVADEPHETAKRVEVKEAVDKSKAQALKLRAAGEKLIADADADSNRDRNTNTARRVSMAANAERDAERRRAIGKTMVNLSFAIEEGEARHLGGVTTRAAVEALDHLVVQAVYEADRHLSYSEQQKRKGRPVEVSDIAVAKLPQVSWGTAAADSARLIDGLKGKKGSADLVSEIRRSHGPTQDLITRLKKVLPEKDVKYGVGWWNIEKAAELARLQKLGITDDNSLRMALAEYLHFREGRKAVDPVKEAERALVGKKVGIDFFPTPKALAATMAEMAGIKPGMTVLEPSAGNGHLADAARDAGADVDTIEMSDTLRNVLTAKKHTIVAHDFEAHTSTKQYDAVLMNPPFSDRKDALHIMRAWDMVKPGGKLVAIAGEGVFFGSDKKAVAFREWLDEHGAEVEKLPDNTFMGASQIVQTGANARLINLTKAAEVVAPAAPVVKKTDAEHIEEFHGNAIERYAIKRAGFGSVAEYLADPQNNRQAYLQAKAEAHILDWLSANKANSLDEIRRGISSVAIHQDIKSAALSRLYTEGVIKKKQVGGSGPIFINPEKLSETVVTKKDLPSGLEGSSAAPASETGHQEGERNADGLVFLDGRWHREDAAKQDGGGRVGADPKLLDGTTVRDADGNLYRVHYNRNSLVVAHQIVDGRAQVSATTSVRFWVNPDQTPAGENDRTDPIYVVDTPVPTAAATGLAPAANPEFEAAEDRADLAEAMAENPHSEKSKRMLATVAQRQSDAEEPTEPDVDSPSSANYRYADTGYIAGSRKEMAAAQVISRAKKDGAQVLVTGLDWEALESNPREAKELITKSNLFGSVDWQALQAGGMEPGAGFLVDRIYSAIATEPSEDKAQARRDYTLGLQTLRERLEGCTTPAQVTDVLDNLREEYDGKILTADESVEYQALSKRGSDAWKEDRAIDEVNDGLYKEMNRTRYLVNDAERENDKRKRRGWAIKPELQEQADALRPAADAAEKAWHEKLEATRARRAELDAIRRETHHAHQSIQLKAFARNKIENPLHRAWNIMGERFVNVLRYRSYKGSDAFAKHVAVAKAGKITDWTWAEKEVTRAPRISKESVRFQLKVADNYERVGGRTVSPQSTMELKEMFGLRDVQSGNWVLRDVTSAKFHTEHCAAAFADLADLLGAPDEQISLNGRLAMAFGARGQGAKGFKDGAARADYSPVHRIINLTKMGGGGCLAHEWFHALDNIAKEAEGMGQSGVHDYATSNPDILPPGELRDAFHALRSAMLDGVHQATEVVQYSAHDVKVAKHNLTGMYVNMIGKKILAAGDVHSAVAAIDDHFKVNSGTKLTPKTKKLARDWRRIAIAHFGGDADGGSLEVKGGPTMSAYAMGAAQLDQGGTAYFSQTLEMGARAFQSWTEDRLSEMGRKNDYLSVYADNKYHRDPITGMQWKPYPEGEERQRINAAFDRLFAAVGASGTLAKAMALGW